jgi:hypothetical protein
MHVRLSALLAAALIVAAPPPGISASELQERTRKAYEAYADEARHAFVARASGDGVAMPPPGEVRAAPGRGDAITDVPGGLVHHWTGAVLVPGATLQRALEVTHDYAGYAAVYKSSVVAATLLQRDADTYRVRLRIKGGGGGVSAVLDVQSTIQYFQPTPRRVYSIATADEIREVKDPGGRNERLLPAGRDSGYLWRGHTLTIFSQLDGGIVIEMESLGLSRGFPPLLGWIIEPIARRLGRHSIEDSLREFAAAIAVRPR